MVLLERFLKYLSLAAADLVLAVAVLLLLAVIYHTSKVHSNLLEVLGLVSTFHWKVPMANHLWAVHYHNLVMFPM